MLPETLEILASWPTAIPLSCLINVEIVASTASRGLLTQDVSLWYCRTLQISRMHRIAFSCCSPFGSSDFLLQINDVHQPFRCCCGQAHADRLFGRFFFDFFHGMLLIDINVYVYIIYVYFNCIIASYRPHNNRKFIFSEKRKLFIARNVNKNSPGHFAQGYIMQHQFYFAIRRIQWISRYMLNLKCTWSLIPG